MSSKHENVVKRDFDLKKEFCQEVHKMILEYQGVKRNGSDKFYISIPRTAKFGEIPTPAVLGTPSLYTIEIEGVLLTSDTIEPLTLIRQYFASKMAKDFTLTNPFSGM